VLGSVAADVLARSTVPLLVVRPVGLKEGPSSGDDVGRPADAESGGAPVGEASADRPNEQSTTGPNADRSAGRLGAADREDAR
jgi:hypothetical protein